jgi:membrane-anchored protein YejM (alkaline phosphatase superfamily)
MLVLFSANYTLEHLDGFYINASNHLDYQFSRIISTLKKEDLLKETIVIITGDHGEEFMENGRWGHNSTFSQQQIRVPLLIHIPGSPAAHYEGMTSHLDIPATVLSALKAGHDPQTYSMGQNLLSSVFDQEFAVISDWHSTALATAHHKFSLSSKANSRGSALTSLDDKAIAGDQQKYSAARHLVHS